MLPEATIDQRLAAVEKELGNLKARVESKGPSANWIERYVEVFKYGPDIAELIEHSRQFREADRQQENGKR